MEDGRTAQHLGRTHAHGLRRGGQLDADDSHGEWSIRAKYYTSSDNYIAGQDDVAASGGEGTLSLYYQQQGGRISSPANAANAEIELTYCMNSGWIAFDEAPLTGQAGVRHHHKQVKIAAQIRGMISPMWSETYG